MNRDIFKPAGTGRWLYRGLMAGAIGMLVVAGTPAWAAKHHHHTATASAPAADDFSERLAAEFGTWLGDSQETQDIVHMLRSGDAVSHAGAASEVPQTGALAYGEARLALKVAQANLAQEGVVQPTPPQLRAALHGGALDTPAGSKVLPGVLPQRAQGAQWGALAQDAGLTVEDLIPPKSVGPKKKARTAKVAQGKKTKGKKTTGKGVAKSSSSKAKSGKTAKATAKKKTKK